MTTRDSIAIYLERHGWTRRIAGEKDFTAAIEAIKLADDSGLGLLIAGPCGVGKTLLVKLVAKAYGPHRFLELSDPNDVEKLSNEWQELWSEDLNAENVVLDDIGAESPVNDYGVRLEPVAVFLAQRHNRFAGFPFPRLFATTNLNSGELDNRYGGRMYSRLKDLCVPLRLTGPDKRRWKIAK